jgi:hypothetical protein
MYSTNNNNSEQNYIYCRNDCGARITFSDYATSKNGKKIPLQENGLPHYCPNSYFNKKRQEFQKSNTGFVEEFDKIGHPALIDSEVRYPDSRPKQEQRSTTLNRKITVEQQLYVDTIGPVIAEIHSIVQEILQHIIRERNENDE